MIRHLFKLIWNRKRANALVISEIFVCFLVLFAVLTQTLYTLSNYRKPLGFNYENVSAVSVVIGAEAIAQRDSVSGPGDPATPLAGRPENPHEARQKALLQLVKADPDVMEAAWARPLPFSHSNQARAFTYKNRPVRYSMAACTDEYKDVMGLTITRGRWFSPEDDGQDYEALVITEALARQIFGDENPVGQSLTADEPEDDEDLQEKRIVGVMQAFRQEGEMDAGALYALSRLSYGSVAMSRIDGMAVRLRPSADARAEARLAALLQAAAPDWSFKVDTLAAGAEFNRRAYSAPIFLVGVVASFLVLMVALGLSGVLWLSVTSRTREIGVRRAMGASASDIRAQVTGELLVMATLAMLAGVAVVLQFPFLDLLGNVPENVFFSSLSLTIVSLYTLALLCAWQPARLATTVHPAEALRYE